MKTKSVLFALVAVSVAAVSHSAQVEWTSGDLNISALQNITSVEACYYVFSDTASDIAALYSGNWGTSDLIVTDQTSENFKQLKSNITSTPAHTETVTDTTRPFNVDWVQTGVEESEYVVAVYTARTGSGGSYAIATIGYFEYDKDNVLEEKGDDSYTSGLGSDALLYNTDRDTNNGGWVAVPEPTTVALLALGLAAVGLKRKVA